MILMMVVLRHGDGVADAAEGVVAAITAPGGDDGVVLLDDLRLVGTAGGRVCNFEQLS